MWRLIGVYVTLALTQTPPLLLLTMHKLSRLICKLVAFVPVLINECESLMLQHTPDGSSTPIPVWSCHKARDPPHSCVPPGPWLLWYAVKKAQHWPGWMLLILEAAPCLTDHMGSLAAGGHCTLSTYTHVNTGNSIGKDALVQTNTNQLPAPPLHQYVCSGLLPPLSVHVFTHLTTRQIDTAVGLTLWEGCWIKWMEIYELCKGVVWDFIIFDIPQVWSGDEKICKNILM